MKINIPTDRKLKVAVLMGGTSSERPVSLATGKMILASLDPDKYDATGIDVPDLFALTPDNPNRPDVVFIALHGKGGEDGTVQGMLEVLGLPYTGSGVLASALAMDKFRTKRLLKQYDVPVIDDLLFQRTEMLSAEYVAGSISARLGGFPVFVKPNAEGSTFGCSLVETPEELLPALENALKYDEMALVEKYIRGTEITVGILEDARQITGRLVLPVVEIVPKAKFYDYESKYASGGSEHIIPARISAELTEKVKVIAEGCHYLLGCRGMSRTDMIVVGDEIFVLEVNTIPGMTPTSLLPDAAAHAGIPFAELLDRIIASALT